MANVATKHYTANDITPNRCTITGVYSTSQAAEAAVESDDESGVFELGDGPEPEVGERAYHRDGMCWGSGEASIKSTDGETYTFGEWLSAAGRDDSASDYDLRAAWRAGEDPGEYT
jgi:hypothetical protein